MKTIEGKAEISFPCKWRYKLIVRGVEEAHEAVFELCDRLYELHESHVSTKGNYRSFNLEIEVASREEMERLFLALKAHPKITMVL